MHIINVNKRQINKKPVGKHLQFYLDYMKSDTIPYSGLCICASQRLIEHHLLYLFRPESLWDAEFSYWGSGMETDSLYVFTPLRQTIVLFMAAINNEL